jgi:hypothetical protein
MSTEARVQTWGGAAGHARRSARSAPPFPPLRPLTGAEQDAAHDRSLIGRLPLGLDRPRGVCEIARSCGATPRGCRKHDLESQLPNADGDAGQRRAAAPLRP